MNQTLLILICCFSFSFTVSSVQAEIFKWTDENGQIHYSDKKPENQRVKEIIIKPHAQAALSSTTDLSETPNTDESETTATKPYKKKQKVTMYSASWCGYCKKARTYFKKNKISYVEYDIEKNLNAKKRYEKLGGVGVPLLVAKRQTMRGFNVAKFERWYEAL